MSGAGRLASRTTVYSPPYAINGPLNPIKADASSGPVTLSAAHSRYLRPVTTTCSRSLVASTTWESKSPSDRRPRKHEKKMATLRNSSKWATDRYDRSRMVS
ncbi:hypothetical protein SPBR_03553 [Sporothrix brasiliensis 5110]|uniref:Uncharacterized protein n=1 Tax=Sporothrix brasiliensis 5110 TaxID=1398154 RepID=A0A0C2J1E4_9PEZI|nr:uncharacterized protein SPBR_03553 [Sporothrix brasiliensis 5110]KIH95146.1 hypothetical protein SPBR_03553 [Sporothrix brasiliensis 5110]